ncbi:MAG: hypothetical protein IJD32_08230 [Bacteroidaceae bacterium]|nr:hypothetical protein [Bacteroidaceae bacterium]
MKGKYAILWVLLLISFYGCSDKKTITDTLHRAEALMNEYPDSAYTLLQTLPVDKLHQDKNRARYALLYSQALDKNYIDETNDSLINIAIDYYRTTDDVHSKFLAFYYQGRVYTNAGELHKAILAYTEAEQLADEVKDGYLVGLLYSEFGRIYRLYYDYPKSLEAYQKASQYYELAGKETHCSYMRLNMSRVCRNMNQYDESERLLQMALLAGKESQDNVLVRLCLGDLLMQAVELQDMAKARTLHNELQTLVDSDWGTASFMGSLAALYASESDFSKARKFIEKGWRRAENRVDSVNLYLSSSEIEYEAGNEKKAYADLLEGTKLQKSESYETLQQPILTVQRDYLSGKLDFQTYKLRMEQYLRVLYIILSALLLAITYLLLKRKLKKEKEKASKTIQQLKDEKKQKEEESNKKIASLLQELKEKEQSDQSHITSIDNLRLELNRREEHHRLYIQEMEQLQSDTEKELQRKSAFVIDLFKIWFATMGKLVVVLIHKDGKEESKNKKLRKEITLWQEKYYVGNKAYREVENLVNLYNDNAMSHFRNEMQWTDESDYRRVCYFFAGFPIQLIARLMDESEDAIYQKRHRLRKVLDSSALQYKELYLRLLCK